MSLRDSFVNYFGADSRNEHFVYFNLEQVARIDFCFCKSYFDGRRVEQTPFPQNKKQCLEAFTPYGCFETPP